MSNTTYPAVNFETAPNSPEQFLKILEQQEIQVWAEGERLRYRAPKGALTDQLREHLSTQKVSLLNFLKTSTEPKQDPHTGDIPLTDLQYAYVLGQDQGFELGNVSAHYYLEFELQSLDLQKLNQALQQLIQRHQALQVRITADGKQQLSPQLPEAQIKFKDWSHRSAESAAEALEAVRQTFANQGPDVGAGELFEVAVYQLNPQHYRLYFSISLIICDALSCVLLIQELFTLYEGSLADLPPLSLSYQSYARALEQQKNTLAYQRARDYWWKRLDTLPPAPALPLAKQPSTLDYPRFKRRSDRLDPSLWQTLQHKAAQHNLKPAALLCAAYASVLNTWNKSDRFTLNVLSLNRPPIHADSYRVIGNFSSTLLLEVDCKPGQAFAKQAQSIQHQLWQDLEYTTISGVEVLGELNRRQGGSSRAGMPVVFASALGLNRDSDSSVRDCEWPLRASGVQTPFVLLDHQVREEQGALILNWDSVDEAFPSGLMEDMFAAYCNLLHRLAEEEQIWHQALQLVPEQQLQQRAQINQTEAPTSNLTLQELFQAQVRQRPDDIAIIASEKKLTYGELDQCSNQVAHWLRQHGTVVNQQVAIVMDKGWEQVVAALGILKAGAAYLPIAPKLPNERLSYLLNNSEVGLVLSQSWIFEQITIPEALRSLCVDHIESMALQTDSIALQQSPSDLAYVIYTSGSTGMPKGVMIDHRGAVNTVLDINRRFGINTSDRIFGISSLSFDLSVYDIFGTLAAGATLVIPDAKRVRDPAHWSEVMQREQVTVWNSAPPLMKLFVEAGVNHAQWLPKSLRHVLLSGDWIPLNLPGQLQAALPEINVVSLGGATEASIWSIFYPISQVKSNWKSIPYGQPLANQNFHVLDSALNPCPTWVSGELYIGGIGLAKGYWKNSEKTAASFIEHSQLGRLYRTGDLGRYLGDGNIEFLGREDFQVKIRGYRIELGEIEAALIQLDSLQAVVVSAIENHCQEKEIVAYIVASSETAPSSEAMRKFLMGKLPDYMIPAAFIELDKLPVTSNGKLDRRALPLPESDASLSDTQYVEPRNQLEKELVEIWKEVLNLSKVGINQNFFELGGNSISAVRLITQIHSRLSQSLPLSSLFQYNTVEALSQAIQKSCDINHQSCLVPIQPKGEARPFFCVHPVGGNVFCYNQLAQHLGRDQPFYGLQSPGLNDPDCSLKTIEGMAQYYIEAIQTIQPTGPYQLGGWSFGTIVAYEMAQQLQNHGEIVKLLVGIDCSVPDRSLAFDDAYFTAWFIKDLESDFELDINRLADELRLMSPEEQFEFMLSRVRAVRLVSENTEASRVQALFQVFKTNLRAMYEYVPQPYSQSLVLLKAESQSNQKYDSETLGWGRLVKEGVTQHTIPGNHYSILNESKLQTLARYLGNHLR